jgi:hypothetical protein
VPTGAARQGFPAVPGVADARVGGSVEEALAGVGAEADQSGDDSAGVVTVAAAGQDQAGDGAVEEWCRFLISRMLL